MKRTMQTRIMSILLVFLVPVLMLAACRPAAEQEPEAEDPRLEPVNAFVDAFESSLDEATQELDVLQTRLEETAASAEEEMETAGEEAGQAYRENLNDLQGEFDKLRRDLQRLSEATDSVASNQREVLADRFYQLEAELESLRMESIQNREELEAAVSSRLDQLDGQIEDLENQARQAEAEMQQAYTGAVEELRMEYREIRKDLEYLQAADEEMFPELRRDVTRALSELKAEVNEAADRMGRLLDPDRLNATQAQASTGGETK